MANIETCIVDDIEMDYIKFGSGSKYKSFLMITLGTGIGSGIFVDGKLYEGNLGKGAEFGHSLLVMDGRQCSCGR